MKHVLVKEDSLYYIVMPVRPIESNYYESDYRGYLFDYRGYLFFDLVSWKRDEQYYQKSIEQAKKDAVKFEDQLGIESLIFFDHHKTNKKFELKVGEIYSISFEGKIELVCCSNKINGGLQSPDCCHKELARLINK